jgi:hypothetical protein
MTCRHQARPEKIEGLGQDDPVVTGGNYIGLGPSSETETLGKLPEARPEIRKTLARRVGIGTYLNCPPFKVGSCRPVATVNRDLMPKVSENDSQLPDSGLDTAEGNRCRR